MRYKDRCMAGFFWKLGSYIFVSGLVKENGKPTNHILHYPYLYIISSLFLVRGAYATNSPIIRLLRGEGTAMCLPFLFYAKNFITWDW